MMKMIPKYLTQIVKSFFIQLLALFFITSTVEAQTICNNQTGTHDGYTYEYWKSKGDGCMKLKPGGFTIDYKNIGNLLARKAVRPGSFEEVVTYDVDFKPTPNTGKSFLSVYGWTKGPLIEYYIVEAWSGNRPTKGSKWGTIFSDGDYYDLYRTERVNKPSIEGTKTFYQYWSVRRNKRTKGTVTTANHFKGWRDAGMNLGTLWEVSFVVEALRESAGFADVKSLSITKGGGGPTLTDDISNIVAPIKVTQGETVTIPVTYKASQARDITVMFQLDSDPWTLAEQVTQSVAKGDGVANIDITIPASTAALVDAYQFQVLITPTGGGWDNRLDNMEQKDVTVEEPEVKGPYNGVATAIPGLLEMEEYDKGGPNVSYSDSDPDNRGAGESNFRMEDGVDIGVGNGSRIIGWTNNDEWVEYTVDVASAGDYNMEIFVSSKNGGGMLGMDVDGQNQLSDVDIPQTGDWDSYTSINEVVNLKSGKQVMRFKIDNSGFNLDKIDFTKSVTTGISNTNATAISIFPNPSNNGVFQLSSEEEWEAYSLYGTLLKSGNGTKIDLSEINGNVFFVKVNAEIIRISKQ